MQDEDKEFKNYIETLPPEIKQAIYSIDYPKKLQEIVKNNKLMIDQAGKLEAETTLVMAGIEPMDQYVKNLQSNVGLSSIQASVVAHDVNESIFKEIRDSLKKINDRIIEEEKAVNQENENLSKENILKDIENPKATKNDNNSISVISANTAKVEIHPEMAKEGIEIRVSNLPEIAPEVKLPSVSVLKTKVSEPYHINTPPVANIIQSKLTETIVVPKETIVIEEKTKLPEKTKSAGDPYRELPI